MSQQPQQLLGFDEDETVGALVARRSSVVDNHRKVLHKALNTVTRLVKTTAKAAKSTQAAAAKAPVQHKALVGAAQVARTPVQKAALKKQGDALARSARAAQSLGKAALKGKTLAVDLAKKMQNQRKVIAILRKPGTVPTKIRGLVEIGYLDPDVYYDLLGASPDPNNPGYLDDGTPDPAADWDTVPTSATDPDASEAPLPPPPPLDTYIPDMELVGGIAYDGSKGRPEGYCLSYGLATRQTDDDSGLPKTAGIDPVSHYGFVFGHYHDRGPEKGIPFGDTLQPGKWNHVHGRYILGGFRKGTWDASSGAEPCDAEEAWQSIKRNAPKGISYGPLIGNPALEAFKGMRVDGKGREFWLPQEAPEWLTYPLRQAAALTAQAEKKAAEHERKLAEAQAAKAKADSDLEAAKQAAESALAEKKAESEAKVAKIQSEQTEAARAAEDRIEAAKQEREANQELLEQSRARREMQLSRSKQNEAAAAILLERAKRNQQVQAQQPSSEEDGGDEYADYAETPNEGEGGDYDSEYESSDQ